jgi:hypothetical protein
VKLEEGDVVYHTGWDQLCIVVDTDKYGAYTMVNAVIDRPIATHAYQGFAYTDSLELISKGDFKWR